MTRRDQRMLQGPAQPRQIVQSGSDSIRCFDQTGVAGLNGTVRACAGIVVLTGGFDRL